MSAGKSASQPELEGLALFATPSAPDPAESPALPSTPGGQLSAARLRKGITVQQVSERLRLSVEAIEALESGAHDALGPQVYVRGHLRRYAEFLGETLPEAPSAVQGVMPETPLEGQRTPFLPLLRVRAGSGNLLPPMQALLVAAVVLALLITIGLLAQPAIP